MAFVYVVAAIEKHNEMFNTPTEYPDVLTSTLYCRMIKSIYANLLKESPLETLTLMFSVENLIDDDFIKVCTELKTFDRLSKEQQEIIINEILFSDFTPAKACNIRIAKFDNLCRYDQFNVIINLCKSHLKTNLEFLKNVFCGFENVFLNLDTVYDFDSWLQMSHYDWDSFFFTVLIAFEVYYYYPKFCTMFYAILENPNLSKAGIFSCFKTLKFCPNIIHWVLFDCADVDVERVVLKTRLNMVLRDRAVVATDDIH